MKLSVIIPLYNEENLIPRVLDKLFSLQLPSYVETFEIVVVDDKSADNSYNVVEEYKQKQRNIKLVRHNENRGKGRAVKTGISHATGDVFLIQDADLELSPTDIPRMLDAMYELKVQFVNGSRYLAGVHRPIGSFKRYFANYVFTLLTSVIIDVRITDMACGYKLFHRELYEKINLVENRFGFEAELIIKALRIQRNNIAEVPVKYFPRNKGEGKKLQNLDGVKILYTIFKYGLLGAK